jgi:hypothetical protein
MSAAGTATDRSDMNAASSHRAPGRGAGLLIAHCAAFEEERPPVVDRLRLLIGPDLTRLLLVALAGRDHRIGSRDLAA